MICGIYGMLSQLLSQFDDLKSFEALHIISRVVLAGLAFLLQFQAVKTLKIKSVKTNSDGHIVGLGPEWYMSTI